MKKTTDWLVKISQRGDDYGNNGGLLDLLSWCDKTGVCLVDDEEAQYFYEHPTSSYGEFLSWRAGK